MAPDAASRPGRMLNGMVSVRPSSKATSKRSRWARTATARGPVTLFERADDAPAPAARGDLRVGRKVGIPSLQQFISLRVQDSLDRPYLGGIECSLCDSATGNSHHFPVASPHATCTCGGSWGGSRLQKKKRNPRSR
jgi:hypothetical protein